MEAQTRILCEADHALQSSYQIVLHISQILIKWPYSSRSYFQVEVLRNSLDTPSRWTYHVKGEILWQVELQFKQSASKTQSYA